MNKNMSRVLKTVFSPTLKGALFFDFNLIILFGSLFSTPLSRTNCYISLYHYPIIFLISEGKFRMSLHNKLKPSTFVAQYRYRK